MKGNVVGNVDVGDGDIGDDGGVHHNAAEGGKAAIWGFANFQSQYPRASLQLGDQPLLEVCHSAQCLIMYICSLLDFSS